MKILLTGATGFIGSEVVRQLVAAGQATRVMIRRPSRAPLLAGLDVEPLYGDLTTEAGGPTVASIRLPQVYGPQSLLFGQVRHRKVVFPGPGENPFAQLHVEDAARVLIGAALQRWSGTAPVADDESVTWNDFFEILTTFAPDTRVLRVPRRLAAGGAAVAGMVLGRRGPTMVSADTVTGWNLSLRLTSGRLWSELGLVPRYRGVLEGIPACLDGFIAFRWRHPVFDRS